MDQNWVQDDTFVPLKTVKKMDEYLSDFAKKNFILQLMKQKVVTIL